MTSIRCGLCSSLLTFCDRCKRWLHADTGASKCGGGGVDTCGQ